MKNITIVADDRVGLLADISYILGKSKINIDAISVDVIAGKAVIQIAVKDVGKPLEILKNSGYNVAETNALILKLDDKPGELSKITLMLADNHVNIESVHILSRDGKATILAMTVDKQKKAQDLLSNFLVSVKET